MGAANIANKVAPNRLAVGRYYLTPPFTEENESLHAGHKNNREIIK
jgi:hypothetical protein